VAYDARVRSIQDLPLDPPRMSRIPVISLVVAVKDGEANLPAILQAVAEAGDAAVEVIFCVAGEPPAALAAAGPGWRLVRCAAESLVPHLWRDGVLAATTDRVMLTNTQCLPTAAWIRRLAGIDLDRYVAVGGPIDNDPAPDPVRWAVFFLRYLRFAPPAAGEVDDVAADNAAYRRSEILRHPDLLGIGLWEPSFHERFLAAGLKMAIDPGLLLTYRGDDRPGRFMAHRFAHGREYGYARAKDAPRLRRLALLAASPLVPLLLVARIIARTRGRPAYRARLPAALPWLAAFSAAWGAGEALGYLRAVIRR